MRRGGFAEEGLGRRWQFLEMFENFSNDARFGDESHQAENTAAGTQERVDLEDPTNQICPPSP
jgi:hypothetical protein